jgi:cysteinyl-tRNA synthetase
VRSYAEYGRLSGRSVDDMIAGARVEVSPFKEDPMDFVLWKPSSSEQPGWAGPKVDGVSVGFGRPGWHIECSAMADELLMKGLPEEKRSFDIHGGGLDLQFPHHENELAQSSCAHPHGSFASVWMHNEMLQVEGKKMSKSLGNFFTVREVLDGSAPLSGGAYTGEEIRAAFLLSHYRSPMDFNVIRRHEARTIVKEMAYQLGMRGTAALSALRSDEPLQPLDDVVTALADDMDTAKAIGCLRSKAYRERYTVLEQFGLHQRIYDSQRLLGFDLLSSKETLYAAQDGDARRGAISAAFDELQPIWRVQDLINEARSQKDFRRADELRDAVIAAGAEVSITKDGAEIKRLASFDIAKLEALE